MPFIPAENVVQVELRFIQFAQQVENTLYYYSADSFGAGDLPALTEMVGDWWDAEIRPYQSSSVTLNEIYATDLTSNVSPVYSDTSRNGQAGGNGATAGLPGNVSIVVSFRTQGRGRSARGRNYFIGLVEGAAVGNTVDPLVASAIEEGYNAMSTYVTFPWQWIVLSRYFEGAPRTEGLIQPVTNAIIVDSNLDSQRRRLNGRGL